MMAFEMVNINFSKDKQYLIKQEVERIKSEVLEIEDSSEDKSASSIYDVEVVIDNNYQLKILFECIHLCINYFYLYKIINLYISEVIEY